MGRFSGVLFASDYDNTLVNTGEAYASGHGQGSMSYESCRAIEYFMAEGGIFSIATGRSYPSFNTVRSRIPMNGPTVLFNGAAIYDYEKEQYIYQAFLPEEIRTWVMQVLCTRPHIACEVYHDDSSIEVLQPNRWFEDHRRLTQAVAVEVPDMDALCVPSPMSKVLLEAEEEELREAAAYIRTQPWGAGYETVFSTPHLLEVTARGATKGGTVKKLSQLLHIAPRNVYCMGDQANDVDMLKIAAIPFAPANAIEEIHKIKGVHILPPCGESTVVSAIEELSRIYP